MTTADEPCLAHLSTRWTWLHLAHADSPEQARAARGWLFERYRRAVARYLRAAVRDADAADDLFQEFALRLTRGDFRNARPDRGRFRDFLRTALTRLVVDYRRRQGRSDRTFGRSPEAPQEFPEPDDDRAFLAAWRADLFERAWAGLRRVQAATGRPVYTVLRLRTAAPDATADDLAARLSAAAGRPVAGGWFRKQLMGARARFADAVVAAVADSLEEPTADAVAEELIDLGLLDCCRGALSRYQPAG